MKKSGGENVVTNRCVEGRELSRLRRKENGRGIQKQWELDEGGKEKSGRDQTWA